MVDGSFITQIEIILFRVMLKSNSLSSPSDHFIFPYSECPIPAYIHLFKSTIETLEKGVKYIQS